MRAARVTVVVLLAAGLAAPSARAQPTGDPGTVVEVPAGDEYADTDPSALTDFRPALDPYGTWAEDPTYGTVWTPSAEQVGAGFQPYDTAGNWDYVDGDYIWASDYAWGWVCFHYGRWAFSAGRWVWIPGRDYAGAWVVWRVGDDAYGYVGWAPMSPEWGWVGGGATALGVASAEPWAFVAYGDLFAPNVPSHAAAGATASTVAAHSRAYVPAQPTVSGGAAARQAPHGPPPSLLGLDVSRLALPALGPRELRARQLARPSTAQPLGAHAPARHVVRPTPRPAAATRGFAGEARGAARGRR
jgi:hypothetical protein